MRKHNIITIQIELIRETDKAYMFDVDRIDPKTKTKDYVWLPKSQCEYDDGELQLPEWLAMEKGLI